MKHVWYIVTRTNPDTGTQEWRCIATESWTAYRCLAHPFGSVEVARCARNKAGDKLARIIKVTWTPKPPKPPKTHDLKWALRMLGRGKKVRKADWLPGCYLHVLNGSIHIQSGDFGDDGNWTVYYLHFLRASILQSGDFGDPDGNWTLYREPSK